MLEGVGVGIGCEVVDGREKETRTALDDHDGVSSKSPITSVPKLGPDSAGSGKATDSLRPFDQSTLRIPLSPRSSRLHRKLLVSEGAGSTAPEPILLVLLRIQRVMELLI